VAVHGDSSAGPLLLLLSSARKTIKDIQEEKICDQKEVIELQKKLISKKDEELGLVSRTVEKELKSDLSALQQSNRSLADEHR
jgi:hypothetical protein